MRFPTFFFSSFMASCLMRRSLIHCSWVLCRMRCAALASLFCMLNSRFPSTVCWICYLFFTIYFGIFVKDQVAAVAWSYTWILCSIPLIYVTLLWREPCCFYYYGSVVQFEIRYGDICHHVVFAQVCFGSFWSFVPLSTFLDHFFFHICEEWH